MSLAVIDKIEYLVATLSGVSVRISIFFMSVSYKNNDFLLEADDGIAVVILSSLQDVFGDCNKDTRHVFCKLIFIFVHSLFVNSTRRVSLQNSCLRR